MAKQWSLKKSKKGYDFSVLRNFNDYLPKAGGLVLNDKKNRIR